MDLGKILQVQTCINFFLLIRILFSFLDKSPKQNGKTYQDALSDEIALRDEILELKRQMLVLKRTNEQNLVKFRKYEDEAKRKDKQIEQLMDPTKVSLSFLKTIFII